MARIALMTVSDGREFVHREIEKRSASASKNETLGAAMCREILQLPPSSEPSRSQQSPAPLLGQDRAVRCSQQAQSVGDDEDRRSFIEEAGREQATRRAPLRRVARPSPATGRCSPGCSAAFSGQGGSRELGEVVGHERDVGRRRHVRACGTVATPTSATAKGWSRVDVLGLPTARLMAAERVAGTSAKTEDAKRRTDCADRPAFACDARWHSDATSHCPCVKSHRSVLEMISRAAAHPSP